MAPKKAKKEPEEEVLDQATLEQEAQRKESERLKELALDTGVSVGERFDLPPPRPRPPYRPSYLCRASQRNRHSNLCPPPHYFFPLAASR